MSWGMLLNFCLPRVYLQGHKERGAPSALVFMTTAGALGKKKIRVVTSPIFFYSSNPSVPADIIYPSRVGLNNIYLGERHKIFVLFI